MEAIDLMIDFHNHAERQGPGSVQDTLRALALMDLRHNQALKIADIGCGTGAQTITLAQNLNGQIIAVDLFSVFLETLNKNVRKLGLSEKIKTLEQSMDALPFKDKEFDIIWSEGGIYNMGFEKGIKTWRDFLKPGGYLAVSEVTWITNTRPGALEEFWQQEYPEIDKASHKINLLEENGYSLAGYFYLAQNSWIENYYKPMASRFEPFLKRHKNTELARQVAAEHKEEIAFYEKYKDYYSYGFYIARKN